MGFPRIALLSRFVVPDLAGVNSPEDFSTLQPVQNFVGGHYVSKKVEQVGEATIVFTIGSRGICVRDDNGSEIEHIRVAGSCFGTRICRYPGYNHHADITPP